MYNRNKLIVLLALALMLVSCHSGKELVKPQQEEVAEVILGEPLSISYVEVHYNKKEYQVEMRDGIKLHTVVYSPKDKTKTYPILMKRTPYSCKPYGEEVPDKIGPSWDIMEDKYIIVYQDVRGRYMSEGSYDNMRPHVPNKKSDKDIDESSDTYDTIDWLLQNISNHNGRVGMWGTSYPGFYAAAGAIEAHPNLKASVPQAPIADFYFDDFHHRGAYYLSYFLATAVFGYQKDKLETDAWYPYVDPKTPDQYQFYMDMGPLKNGDKYYGKDNFFWQQLKEHPNYDEFWQQRSILPHLKNINHAVMVVGGWFDAEDLYGPLMIYKTIEKNNTTNKSSIVMGPWSHGDWGRDKPQQTISGVYFGDNISSFYQKEIEFDFLTAHLKGEGQVNLPEAYMFDTGSKKWKKFEQWPAKEKVRKKLVVHDKGKLSFDPITKNGKPFTDFLSDPAKPVPYSEDIKTVFTPRKYMADDQRFAGRRPDVLVFQTDVLEEAVTLGGEILAKLKVATTGTDADWVVKLIDVYPPDHPEYEHNAEHIKMGGYQQMVRSEVVRGRFRNSFEHPEPFIPNQVTDVDLPLQDVLHTFKKGHRIMIQIQSTWFPLIDRNPQKYVPNIFEADEEDFIKATHKIYHSTKHSTHLEVDVLE